MSGKDLNRGPFAEPMSSSNQEQMVSLRSSKSGVALPADHLLHLIQYNVLRGVHHAKYILAGPSAFIIPGIEKDEIRPGHVWFLGRSIFFATRPGLPESLVPTSLQMDIIHSTWINFLPIPKMRDNLIAKETSFDHAEFVRDLLGDKIVEYMFGSFWSSKPSIASKLALTDGDDDDVTTSRQGLILWGGAAQCRKLGSDAWIHTEMGLGYGGVRGVNCVEQSMEDDERRRTHTGLCMRVIDLFAQDYR